MTAAVIAAGPGTSARESIATGAVGVIVCVAIWSLLNHQGHEHHEVFSVGKVTSYLRDLRVAFLERHSRAHAKSARAAILADETRRRKPLVRDGNRHIPSIERVANPELAEQPLAASAGAKVGEVVSVLARGVGLVVLEFAGHHELTTAVERNRRVERVRELRSEQGREVRGE